MVCLECMRMFNMQDLLISLCKVATELGEGSDKSYKI